MLTSNVQLVYVLTRGGGQAVQGGLSCPPPRYSERTDTTQILFHHLLQEYLVERDINFISVSELLQTFSWVTYWQGVGSKLSRAVYLAIPPPAQHFKENWISAIFITSPTCTSEISSWKGYKFYFSQSEMLLQTLYIDKGWGASWPGRFILPRPPPAQNFKENWLSAIFITSPTCTSEIFSWKGYKFYFSQSEMLTSNIIYWQGVGGKLTRVVYLAPCPEFQRELIIHKFYYTIYFRNI